MQDGIIHLIEGEMIPHFFEWAFGAGWDRLTGEKREAKWFHLHGTPWESYKTAVTLWRKQKEKQNEDKLCASDFWQPC